MGFLKIPYPREIQIEVIFTKSAFRIIQITKFDQKSDVLPDSDILCEIAYSC